MQHDAQLVPIASLKPYKGNARTHNLDVIRESLRVNGQFRPVVVRSKTREVLAGNGTMAAAIEEGWDELWATFVDVDARAAKRIVLVDNRANDLAGYDDGALAKLLEGLPTLDGTGFDDGDLASLLAGLDDGDPGRDTEPAEPPADPKTRLGDLWVLGEHRLLCGAWPCDPFWDESLISVITDPPYGISIVGANGHIGAGRIAKVRKYRPVIGDDRAFDPASLLALEVPTILWGGNHYASRLPDSSSWMVWDKRSEGHSNNFADCELAWSNIGGPARTYRQVWNGMIREGESGARVHPTQKPVGLFEWCIGMTDGAVLDPYLGSGSTLIAAENLGRRCYAMEIDAGYVDVCVDRWERHTGRTATREPAADREPSNGKGRTA